MPQKKPAETVSRRVVAKVFLVIAVLVVGLYPAAGSAGQESTDARLLKVFKDVDTRNRVHEETTKRALEGLEEIKAEIDLQEKELAALPASLSEAERARHEAMISAKMINGYARLYNRLGKHLDARATLIGKNLSDLGRVVKELHRSGKSTGGVKELQARIEQTVATGRSMKRALTELRNSAQQNPRLLTKADSLNRLLKILDQKVSLSKAQLVVQRRSALAGYGNRTVDTLNAALDRLADQYTEVMAEKDALRTVKGEITIAIEIGRLQATQRFADKTIPGGPGGTSLPPLLSIARFTEKIGVLNDRIIRQTNRDLSDGAAASITTGTTSDDFINF